MSFAEPKDGFLSVTQLNELVKMRLEEDFPKLWVAGEIANLATPASGHAYFTLKDESCSVRAVMFKPYLMRFRKQLQEGKKILLRCKPGLYTARGEFQVLGDEARMIGLGEQQLLLLQLKEKLKGKGYFDPARKKKLPSFPKRIALVTSSTGSAIRDLLEVLGKRWPLAHLVLKACRVQGEQAPAEIAQAIHLLNKIHASGKLEFDVMIVGRGGGSQEDLWAFNAEEVADAIFASRIPVISAVGHEDDLTLADLVADFRAVTPTEAACAATPDSSNLLDYLQETDLHLRKSILQQVTTLTEHLKLLTQRKCFKQPMEWVHVRLQRLDELSWRLNSAGRKPVDRLLDQIRFLGEKLESLSPLKTLQRGYSLTLKHQGDGLGSLVTQSSAVSPGELVQVILKQGKLLAEVKATSPESAHKFLPKE